MYSVFKADGSPKRNRVGLAIFERTLAAARAQCEPGDRIVGWASSGAARGSWQCGADGKVRKQADRSRVRSSRGMCALEPARELIPLMSGLERLEREIRCYLAFVALARGEES